MDRQRLMKRSLLAAMFGVFLHNAVAGPLEWVSAELNEAEEAEVDKLVLPMPQNWLGDFAGMQERRLIRILVPYSKTFYLVDRGQQHGISYELGKGLEEWLNRTHPLPTRPFRWQVMFIPVARDELFPRLISGGGDIAAGGLTITNERLKSVDFAEPFNTHVREAVITGPESGAVKSLEDLAGQEVTVRASSSYYEHLTEINKQFKNRGLEPIKVIAADENLESEDLLEMLNAGLLNAVVVDRYIAEAWHPLYTDLKIHDEFYIHSEAHYAWAIRRGSPVFKQELSNFVRTHKEGTTLGTQIYKKYVKNSKRVLNSVSESEMKKFKELVGLFEKHAGTYDFDYLMLMAQGFQESRLNQSARSPRGAVGIMQLLPTTASDPSIGVQGIESSADKNIEAGSKYMRLLADTYLNDPELTPMNRTLLAFAAYNAGPGNLRKFRRLAEKSGLDKNVWFGNVEHAAARVVGRETVDYVGNIYKYYVAYKLAEEKNRHRAELRKSSATRY